MTQTFKAWLKGDRLEWIEEAPALGESAQQVQVTVVVPSYVEAGISAIEPSQRGRQMAAILAKLANTPWETEIDGSVWQREIRQDRPLPGR